MSVPQACLLSPTHFAAIAEVTPFTVEILTALYAMNQYSYVVRVQEPNGEAVYLMPARNVVMGFGTMRPIWNDAYLK